MTIYQVKHLYDTDGGFGDAIGCSETIAIFSKPEDAEAFKKKYEKPHAYDKPYSYLFCGELEVVEMEVLESINDIGESDEKGFWWLHNREIEIIRDEDDDYWDDDEEEDDEDE